MSKTFKSADYDNRELMVDACFGEPRLMILTIGDASGANTALTPKTSGSLLPAEHAKWLRRPPNEPAPAKPGRASSLIHFSRCWIERRLQCVLLAGSPLLPSPHPH